MRRRDAAMRFSPNALNKGKIAPKHGIGFSYAVLRGKKWLSDRLQRKEPPGGAALGQLQRLSKANYDPGVHSPLSPFEAFSASSFSGVQIASRASACSIGIGFAFSTR